MKAKKIFLKSLTPLEREAYNSWEKATDIVDQQRRKAIRSVVKKYKKHFSYRRMGELFETGYSTLIKYGKYGLDGFPRHIGKDIRKNRKRICVECGKSKFKQPNDLHLHHIHGSTNHSETNLVLLCNSCHAKVHSLKRKEPAAYTSKARGWVGNIISSR